MAFFIDLANGLLANVLYTALAAIPAVVGACDMLAIQCDFSRLFGRRDRRFTVYLSNLWDWTIKTRQPTPIASWRELNAARAITQLLSDVSYRYPKWLRKLLRALDRGVSWDLEPSSHEEIANELPRTNLILIGSSAKNSVRRLYLKEKVARLQFEGESEHYPTGGIHESGVWQAVWLTKPDGEKELLSCPADMEIAREEQAEAQRRITAAASEATRRDQVPAGPEPSAECGCDRRARTYRHNYAIVEKMLDTRRGTTAIACAGVHGDSSWAAVEYLVRHWRDLAKTHEDRPFALCLYFPFSREDMTEYTEPEQVVTVNDRMERSTPEK